MYSVRAVLYFGDRIPRTAKLSREGNVTMAFKKQFQHLTAAQLAVSFVGGSEVTSLREVGLKSLPCLLHGLCYSSPFVFTWSLFPGSNNPKPICVNELM